MTTDAHEHRATPLLPHLEATHRLEDATGLDGTVGLLRRLSDPLLADAGRRAALHGRWLGHALHPLMTDAPIGFWVSANTLDLVGGEAARPATSRLLALGIATAVPTAVTGLAEWGATGPREQRVGVVHAAANTVALTCYTASLAARRRGHHRGGVLLGLAGAAATGLGGYLGGHLVSARKVSSRHPTFADDRGPTRP